MASYVGTHLKQAWDLLIHLCFFQHCMQSKVPVNGPELGVSRCHQTANELVECAVCLSTIEEDDEIRVLRCNHLFHKGCLDQCVEYRHTTCPLCRDVLAGPRMVGELGRELLNFSFCSTDDDCDNWWIR
ncbi:E3 ubiquitin-protein ligase RHA2A-like [Bidens hawaiensis]|uniref:E3 ubiquitin-protein ligase RHA2A-like n=1 Tax=Bidens hawaiensis TaxID=980011 RepID=UPI004049AA52